MAVKLQYQTFTTVAITDEERIAGTISDENIAVAIHALHKDGVVCIENAAALDHVETLNEKLCAEVDMLRQKRGTHYVNVRSFPISQCASFPT